MERKRGNNVKRKEDGGPNIVESGEWRMVTRNSLESKPRLEYQKEITSNNNDNDNNNNKKA